MVNLLGVGTTINLEQDRVLGLARVVHARGPDLAHVELCEDALGWVYARVGRLTVSVAIDGRVYYDGELVFGERLVESTVLGEGVVEACGPTSQH